MSDPRHVRTHIEHLIERAQDEILDASRQLTAGITKGADRFVPPASKDIERLVDEAFDFTERVIKGQRKVVSEVVKSINEQSQGQQRLGAKPPLGPARCRRRRRRSPSGRRRRRRRQRLPDSPIVDLCRHGPAGFKSAKLAMCSWSVTLRPLQGWQ
jgi:ribosomal protein L17